MKKRGFGFIAAVLMIAVAVPAAAAGADPAAALAEKGILTGYEDGILRLDGLVTRAEFVKMLAAAYRAEYDPELETEGFPDVPRGFWAYEPVMAARQHGFVSGDETGMFHPDAPVLYEQALKMVVAAEKGAHFSYPEGYIGAAIDAGYADRMEALIGEPVTRQDAVYLIYNALCEEQELVFETGFGYSSPGSFSTSSFSGGGSVSAGGGGGAPLLNEYGATDAFQGFHTEEYTAEPENRFKTALTSPLSTFSIDVDTASYSNMRRFLLGGSMPPAGSIRTEELINYFDYDRPENSGDAPFSVSAELHDCPWNEQNKLVMLALHGNELPQEARGQSNLVFLIDTSGSMYAANKLPLVVKSMELLLETLDERDTISIVAYAGSAGMVLEPTPASEKEKILDALKSLRAGGSTAGAAGITLAYETAVQNRVEGNNRVILCTDGDFNVGISSTAELEKFIEEKRDAGIYLSVLGFGMGNYKDNRMETLADKGNGNYAYIDSLKEAKKVLVEDMTKTLYTVADDVKLQVEFNPDVVSEYRLVGYENRNLENEDFADDAVDAGEMGAGHQVTAFYELKMADGAETEDPLRYQDVQVTDFEELLFLKIRYKKPGETESTLLEIPVANQNAEEQSAHYRFASAVAAFGMLLNRSEYKGSADYGAVIDHARRAKGTDQFGLRAEFIQLADLARYLDTAEKELS